MGCQFVMVTLAGSWWSLSLATEPTSAALPPEFVTCYGIKRTGERLACYDRAVEYLRQSGDKAAAPSPEASFGLQGTIKESRKETAETEQTSSVTARISEVSNTRDGMKTITLDNGQTWRQITGSTTVSLNLGDEVTVTRAALGSFLMRIPNGGPLRVRRLE